MLLMTAAGLVLGPAAVKDPKSLDGRLDRLLIVYKKYGLPLPPPGTPLVRYQSRPAEKGEPVQYGLAFQLAPAQDDRPALLLFGSDDPDPAPSGASVEVVEIPDPARFGKDTWFTDVAFAIQCHERGWHPLAQEALVRYLAEPDFITPEESIHAHGWSYWTAKITKPGTDRAVIARQLKVALATGPDPAAEHKRALIRSLELALVPSKAKPGSIDAMIDDLLEMTSESLREGRDTDPRYHKLAMLGFDAVPTLIAHLDDERLTRAYQHGFNNFVGYHCRICDFASDLLQNLSGQELGKSGLHRLSGYQVEKADAETWWKEARKVGEEAYLTRHALTEDANAKWPNGVMLKLLTEKYPDRLPEVYRRLLDERPKMAGWTVARAVSASALPREVRRNLLLDGVRRKNLSHRADALEYLRPLDPRTYDRILRETLEALPKTPAGEYWLCPEVRFAHLVTETTNSEVWAALTEAARRADPGLRLELLHRVVGCELPAGNRKLVLTYLAGFLNDDTVRDTSTSPDKFSGPCAGFHYPRLEVRDFAAMELARALKLKTKPAEDWTPADWAKLRAEVREALAREGVR